MTRVDPERYLAALNEALLEELEACGIQSDLRFRLVPSRSDPRRPSGYEVPIEAAADNKIWVCFTFAAMAVSHRYVVA